jgi:uncharacterized membrane protein
MGEEKMIWIILWIVVTILALIAIRKAIKGDIENGMDYDDGSGLVSVIFYIIASFMPIFNIFLLILTLCYLWNQRIKRKGANYESIVKKILFIKGDK